MKNIINRIIKKILRTIKNCINPDYNVSPTPDTPEKFSFLDQDAANYIFTELNTGKPLMISRFGSVELSGICMHLAMQNSLSKRIRDYFSDKNDYLWWDKEIFLSLKNNAGFFSADKETLNEFTKLYLDSMRDIDILGSWYYKEKYVKNKL